MPSPLPAQPNGRPATLTPSRPVTTPSAAAQTSAPRVLVRRKPERGQVSLFPEQWQELREEAMKRALARGTSRVDISEVLREWLTDEDSGR